MNLTAKEILMLLDLSLLQLLHCLVVPQSQLLFYL